VLPVQANRNRHVWNLCDFKTPQSILRPQAMNQKGVFTRDHRPKLAAHRLRQLWAGLGEGTGGTMSSAGARQRAGTTVSEETPR
jgi:hypothetical protein